MERDGERDDDTYPHQERTLGPLHPWNLPSWGLGALAAPQNDSRKQEDLREVHLQVGGGSLNGRSWYSHQNPETPGCPLGSRVSIQVKVKLTYVDRNGSESGRTSPGPVTTAVQQPVPKLLRDMAKPVAGTLICAFSAAVQGQTCWWHRLHYPPRHRWQHAHETQPETPLACTGVKGPKTCSHCYQCRATAPALPLMPQWGPTTKLRRYPGGRQQSHAEHGAHVPAR